MGVSTFVGLQRWACPLLWGCKRANWAFELKGPSNLCLVSPNLCPSVCLVSSNLCPSVCLVSPKLWEICVHVSSTMCKIWETYVVQFHWQYSEIVNTLFIANLNASLHDSPHFSLYTSLVPPCPVKYCEKKQVVFIYTSSWARCLRKEGNLLFESSPRGWL